MSLLHRPSGLPRRGSGLLGRGSALLGRGSGLLRRRSALLRRPGLLDRRPGLLDRRSGLLDRGSGLLHQGLGVLHRHSGLLRRPSGLLRRGDAAGEDRHGTALPLYPRLLRLRHVRPGAWQRAALAEGVLGVAVLLVLADVATAWTLLALPLAVAGMVKAHDVLAGLLRRPGGH